jgi:hypothetical protein
MFLLFNTPEMITDDRDDLVTVFRNSLDRLQQDTHTNTDINNVKASTDRLIKKILEILETEEKVALKNQLLFILQNITSVSRELLPLQQSGGGPFKRKDYIIQLKKYFTKDLLFESKGDEDKNSKIEQIINQTIKDTLTSQEFFKKNGLSNTFINTSSRVVVNATGGYRIKNKSKKRNTKSKKRNTKTKNNKNKIKK